MSDVNPRDIHATASKMRRTIKKENASSSQAGGSAQKRPAPATATIPVPKRCKTIDLSLLYEGPMVRIYVGPENQEFMVHRNLIRSQSKHLEEKFDTKGSMRMSEMNAEVFSLFNRWMYSGSIFPTGKTATTKDIGELLILWLFAADVKLPKLQDMTLTDIHAIMEASESPESIGFSLIVVMMDSARNDNLRKYAIDWYTWRVKTSLDGIYDCIFDDRRLGFELYQALKRRYTGPQEDPTLNIRNYFVEET